MRYKDLSKKDKKFIEKEYNKDRQKSLHILADKFEIHTRTVEKWAQKLGLTKKGKQMLGLAEGVKIMVYDLETSGVNARVWWPGKQYVGYKQLQGREPKIITVAWKWLGENEVFTLTWDENNDDRKLVKGFVEHYNEADAVIGVNNDNFDNRWLNARAFKYGLFINTNIRSIDIQKQAKALFRLPSYSMDFMAKFLDVTNKQPHSGISMWEKIENGTPSERKDALEEMVDYNIGDIITTEEIYIKMRRYMKPKSHFGVLVDKPRWSCPNCGGEEITLFKTVTTAAGTIQRLMTCDKDGTQFKLSNTNYIKYLER